MSEWFDSGILTEIPEGRLHPVSFAQRDWVLVRQGEELVCFLDRCSHQDIRLSEFGHLDGGTILCFAHGARFCQRTGQALCWPGEAALLRGLVRIEAGRVLLAPPPELQDSSNLT